MEIRTIEFHAQPDGSKLVQLRSGAFVYSKETFGLYSEFTARMVTYIENEFPEAYDSLREWFRPSRDNLPYFRYLIADQFIGCNCCGFDLKLDIDEEGLLSTEPIPCPIRARCPYNGKVCNPRPRNTLSEREYEVMKLYYLGLNEHQIATRLCISVQTVRKHKANAFRRLEVHDMASFIRKARDTKLFGHDCH